MILYTAIARTTDGVVLAEGTLPGVEGNHPQITTELISALRRNPNLVTAGNHRTFAYSAFTSTEDGPDSPTQSQRGLLVNPMDGIMKGLDAYDGFLNKVVAEVVADESDDESDCESPKHGSLPLAGRNIKADTHKQFLAYYFHVSMAEYATFICISDDRAARHQKVNFSYLLELQRNFTHLYTPNRIEKAIAYGMDKPFAPTITSLMNHYNTNRKNMLYDPHVVALKAQVDSLKTAMGDNIVLAMHREHKLERLIQRSQTLEERSKVFTKRAKTAKQILIKKKYFCKILMVAFSGLMLYLLFAMICGFDGHRCAVRGRYRNPSLDTDAVTRFLRNT